QGELIGRQGKDYVSIPIPQIDLPRFKFGRRQMGGVGQGEGAPGTPLGPGEDEEAGQKAGNASGEHTLEMEISLQELAEMLGQELELPRIQPKGSGTLHSQKYKYSGINSVGPNSLRHVKRTFKEALKRQIMVGGYDPLNPMIVPIKKDFRYRT